VNSSDFTAPHSFQAQTLRDKGVVVFPIVVKSDRVLPYDNKAEYFLKRLAEETGGVVFNTTNVKEAHKVFASIQELLASQFELQYQPGAGGDGKFHKLRIDFTDKNLKVRHPSGYYAKP
jgi:hypothetical protein